METAIDDEVQKCSSCHKYSERVGCNLCFVDIGVILNIKYQVFAS